MSVLRVDLLALSATELHHLHTAVCSALENKGRAGTGVVPESLTVTIPASAVEPRSDINVRRKKKR